VALYSGKSAGSNTSATFIDYGIRQSVM